MIYSQAELNSLLAQFLSVSQKNISVKEMYLFGSYATGRAHHESDIDAAVVSDEFQGSGFFDRKKLTDIIISETYPKLEFVDIQVHPFSMNEFNDSDPLAEEVLKTGKKIL